MLLLVSSPEVCVLSDIFRPTQYYPNHHPSDTRLAAALDSSCRQSAVLICRPRSLICRHATKCEDLIELNQSEIDFIEQRLVDSAVRS